MPAFAPVQRPPKPLPARAAPPIQTKLEVGAADDHYERQADAVAASVMRGSGPVSIPPTISPLGAQRQAPAKPPEPQQQEEKKTKAVPKASAGTSAQRKTEPAPSKKEEKKKPEAAPARGAKAQRKAVPAPPRKDEKKKAAASPGTKAQRKASASPARKDEKKKPAPSPSRPGKAQREAAAGAAGGTASPSVDTAIRAMQSGPAGRLDGSTRSFMEGRFGRDFSNVRIHHDSKAAETADAIGARAFTTGNDIFFNRGEYRPSSSSGRTLLAHELTHTVQQSGAPGVAARSLIQRAPPPAPPAPATAPPAGQAGGTSPDPAKPAVTTLDSTKLPGASIDTTDVGKNKGTITLPELALPEIGGALKGVAGGLCKPVAAKDHAIPVRGAQFDLQPVQARNESSKAFQVWTAYAQTNLKAGVKKKVEDMVKAQPDAASIKENGQPVYYLTFRSKLAKDESNIFIGTIEELANSDGLLRPQWGPDGKSLEGKGKTLDADHFLELQLGGEDSGANMWLLQGEYNSAVGSAIKTNIENDLKKVKADVDQSKEIPASEKPADVSEMKRSWLIRFKTVEAGKNFPNPAKVVFWSQGQISEGIHIDHLKVMSEPDLVKAGLRLKPGQRPDKIKIFPSLEGGRMREIRVDPTGKVQTKAFLYSNIWVEGGTYNHAEALDAAETPLMKLDVLINKKVPGKKELIEEKRGPIDIKRAPRLGIAGYVSRDSLRAAVGNPTFRPLSPLTFDDVGVSPEGDLVATGNVLSSKALFPNLKVPLNLRGDRISLDFPVPAEGMSLGPLKVTECALSLGVDPRGFFVEGYAGFALGNLGTGSVTASLLDSGPELEGDFNLSMDFLNPANVHAKYVLATDTLTASVTAGVQKGRIPGVDSGTVTVGISREAVDVSGTLNLAAPLSGTTINVGWTEAEGLKIGADNIPLPLSKVPAVQNATMSILAQKPPGADWIFSGSGQATLAIPGATGTLGLDYQNGLFTVTGQGKVEKGPATGTLDFTATNRQIDADGKPIEGPPADEISVWGKGSVSVKFGKILTGTAGIEYTPDQRIILSGAIALPPTYELFKRRDYEKDLFRLSPPEFPIWGVSVAGIGVGVFAFVDARVSFNAYVGPGQIRNAEVGAVMDLDHPEDATITGHGEFYVPAYAGLALDVGGGLRARAAVAFVEGRVGLTGELGIEASASAAIDINWSRQAGLALTADLRADAHPKFELSANASVTVGVDLLLTSVSHTFGPWKKVLGSFGPDMTLGVHMPVKWSEADGLDLSLDNIEIIKPSLDAGELMTSVFDQLAG